MKIIRGLLLLALFLLDIAIGVFLIALGMGIISIETVLSYITDITTLEFSNLGMIGIGFLLILIRLFLLFSRRKKKAIDKDKYISFDNPEGQVLVSVSAIEDFIKKVGRGFSQIREIVPKVIANSGGVVIKMKVILWAGGNIPAFSEELQREMKTQIQDVLGIENVQKIDLTISEIAEKKGSGGKKAEKEEEEGETPVIPYRD